MFCPVRFPLLPVLVPFSVFRPRTYCRSSNGLAMPVTMLLMIVGTPSFISVG